MTALFLAAWLLPGCKSDQNLNTKDDHIGRIDEAEIEVSREEIDFGSLSAGETVAIPVTVTNVGTEGSELNVTAISMPFGGDAGFAIVEAPGATALRHMESLDFIVSFTAADPEVEHGQVVVSSDDRDEGESFVTLIGEGLMPELVITPDPLDFGATTVGCPPREDEFILTNVGNDDLEITEIVSDSTYGEFDLATRPPFPLVIRPGEDALVQMVFSPTVAGSASGSLVVTSNDPRGTVTAAQVGSAGNPGGNTDPYTVPSAGKIDILFAVDQSDSMNPVQDLLGQQAAAFATALGAVTDDWRIGVVTGDTGCLVGGIMDASTPDFPTAFTTAVQAGSEEDGGYRLTESLIYLAAKVVEQSGGGQCNEGFPRTDALFHVIPLSDETNDGDGVAPEDWRTSLETMVWHQDASYLVKVSPVVNLDYAGTYLDAAAATHGTPLDLMSAWSEEVDTVAASEIHRSTFPVLGDLDLPTLRVYVNGMLRTTGWQWRDELHAVVFSEDVPYTGDLVELVYQSPLECP